MQSVVARGRRAHPTDPTNSVHVPPLGLSFIAGAPD